MRDKDQDKSRESTERRDFLKQAGLTVLGGIAFTALLGSSPATADAPGMKRLLRAMSEQSEIGALDWNCQYPGYVENGNPCAQGYVCRNSVECSLNFNCHGGNDDAYGCSGGRNFQCGAMDGHPFYCGQNGGQFNCNKNDGHFQCTVEEEYHCDPAQNVNEYYV